MNGNSYLAMLNEFVVPNIRDQLGVGNNGRFTRGDNSDKGNSLEIELLHWISFFGDTLNIASTRERQKILMT